MDGNIVRTVDYSDDPLSQKALNRPQYIQLNFVAGGNWPGDTAPNLARLTYKVEYVYYAQNPMQKVATEAYYTNTVSLQAEDVEMYVDQKDVDLLANLHIIPGSEAVDFSQYRKDFSIDDTYMFSTYPTKNTDNQDGRTVVDRVISDSVEALLNYLNWE